MPVPYTLDYHSYIVSWKVWVFHSCVSIQRLFWLFWVPCNSIWLLESACQFFFSFKSRYNWHTLYQFQVYNSICMHCEVITTVNLVNVHHHTYLQNCFSCNENFLIFIFISWRLITLQYCSGFCHTLAWIIHGFTCVAHPDPHSHLPFYTIPLGLPSAPGLSTCLMHPTWAGDLFHYR